MESAPLPILVQQLRAAGEPTRARILALLAHGELSVGELVQVLSQSQPRLSRHLKFLTAAGLVERLPEGAWVFYRLPVEGRSREFVDILNAAIDPADTSIRRDLERLEEVKGERFRAAGQYFSRVAEEWDRLRALHYSDADLEKAVLAAAGPGPFDLVADFGTGTGRMLALFAQSARRVEGIDLSHQMLTVARSNLESAGITNASVRHGDATAAPYPDHCANLVIIHQVLHFLDDPARAISEAARVLKPGGRLIVVDFAPHTLEHLREEHAHRHLGVSEADFQRWAEKAGLHVRAVKTFRAPAGGKGVAVTVWTADAKAARAGRAA
ncbi:MAG TPA: metalloregulator ArsR/SmtB family transcription factor [Hyphomonadaceae bacterium]|nr:metalloregulator ArsR/SmtB family transcription factor [Hyphomonadaceae bacterium]